MKYILLLSLIAFNTSCSSQITSTKFKVGNDEQVVDIYSSDDPKKVNKNIAFIILHGKKNGRHHSGNVSVASELSSAGYTVYAPEMPYSDYSGTLNDSFKLIDNLVKKAATGNKKVILVGHSMGSAIVFLYCAAYTCAPEVSGVVMGAPGHMLQLSHFIQEGTALAVQRARKLVKQGKGKIKGDFPNVNQGEKYFITTTPDIYLSYFDPAIFPNPATHLDTIKVPVLWIDGINDSMAARMGYENIFNRLNKYTQYKQNKYLEVSGGHVDMMYSMSDPILTWVKQF